MVMGDVRKEAEVLVIGGGPGGYVAAIRAADLGKDVTLIEMRDRRGGVCLIEGCIPSKTLISAVELADTAKNGLKFGVKCDNVGYDLDALRKWTDDVVSNLTKGVDGLLKSRGVDVIQGRAFFENDHSIKIFDGEAAGVTFKHCIIATGSRIVELPFMREIEGIWASREALRVPRIPETMLVIGGGYIGLELGLVYAGLGSKITLCEMMPNLLPNAADDDLVDVVHRNCKKKFERILLETKAEKVEKIGDKYRVVLTGKKGTETVEFDQILVAVGRRPNTDNIGLENTSIKLDERGLIVVDAEMRTSAPHIFAIGDIVPGFQLAHKASREGKIAAEVLSGHPAAFDNRSIPAVVFTHPEISWTGLTEREAKEQNIEVKVGKFPLVALGRARTIGQTDGFCKVIADAQTDLILGVAVVGPHASELIAEGALALEMGATLEDLMATIHPHPTLSESIMEAAEAAAGMPVHMARKKK